MVHSRLRIAAAALALAACSTDSTPDEDVTTAPLSSSPTLAFDGDALALMSTARRTLFTELAGASARPPRLVAEIASKATTAIALELPPLAASPRDSARAFVKKYQALLDDRVQYWEQRDIPSPAGCGETVIMFDRFIGGKQVIGSRLTLHFDERGYLVFVTNGTAPVPATTRTVDPSKLPGARPLASLLPKQLEPKGLRRIKVLAPLPDGSGVHEADLVPWLDERGEYVSALAVGDTAFTGKLAASRDGSPHPTGTAPRTFTASGETVPSYVSYRDAGGIAVNGLPIERNPVERVYRFLEEHATLYRTGEARCQFVPRQIQESPEGGVHVRIDQHHGRLPVFGAELVVNLDGTRVTSVLGHTIDNLDVRATPLRTAAQAIAAADVVLDRGVTKDPAWAGMVAKSRGVTPVTRLGVLPRWLARAGGASNGGHRLVWQVQRGAFTFYVDAEDGVIRNQASGIHGARIVDDALGGSEFAIIFPGYAGESVDGVHLPGAPFNLDTAPGRAGGSTSAGLTTIDALFAALGWRGQNGGGSDYVAHTNAALTTVACQNAFFDSTFTSSAFFCLGLATNDVLAHELTHGVIASSSRLVYQDESGAINEAFADLMGNTIFREPGGGWLIGENDPVGGAIRNMAAPAHVSTYRHRDGTCDVFPWSCDNGFVHTNSAIINNAHQLLADGVPGVTTGIGRDKLFMLGFRTMTTRLPGNARMNDVPLAERDVCEGFVRAGAVDLTGAPWVASDCDQIATAFLQVGLAPGLSSGWSEPTLGFEGTETFFPNLILDRMPGDCSVTNIEGNLVQLSGAQTIDMSPATAIPASVTWLELSRLSLRIPPGTPPFPLGTAMKRHTVDWFAVYGVRPSFYTTVIPSACTPVLDQSRSSASFVENNPFGGGSASRVLGTTNTVPTSCVLTRADLELVGGDGRVLGNSPSASPSHTITHWFLFIPVNFTMRASVLAPPPTGITVTTPTRDLSGTISFAYDVGRGINVRWRYTFSAPAGIDCTPLP